MINIQAINVPIQLSVDGINWETVVCISDHTLPIDSAINKINTQCGIAVGLGPVEFNPTGTGVTTTNPVLPGQVTTKTLSQWAVSQQLLYYRMQQNTSSGSIGGQFYLCGLCYLTKFDINEVVGDVEKFSFTLSGVGTPVTTPGALPS